MKKWANVILPTVLAISLVAPVSAFAHGGGPGKGPGRDHGKGKPPFSQHQMAKPPAPPVQQQIQSGTTAPPVAKPPHRHGHGQRVESGKGHGRGHVNGALHNGQTKQQMKAIKRTFFVLLVEKYSPETLSAWQTTVAESDKLHTDIRAIVKANPEFKAKLKTMHTVDLKSKMEENKATRAEFNAAITAQDAAKINAALAKILTQIQARNAQLTTKLTELQKLLAEKQAAANPTTPTDPGTADPGTTDPQPTA